MKWVRICVECPPDAEESVCAVLTDECGGVSIEGDGTLISGWLPVDDRLEGRILSMRTNLDSLPSEILAGHSCEITLTPDADVDWLNAWREHFRAFNIGRFSIHPPWEELPAATNDNDQIRLVIDPGMAFGTGQHPTTELMLRYLSNADLKGRQVLDVGSGSGILAIAASLLGAAKVKAVEVDPVAEENARQNIRLNRVDHLIDYEIQDASDTNDVQYDIVVMNIVADVILRLLPGVWEKIKPEGTLICSGIIEERLNEILHAVSLLGCQDVKVESLAEWRSVECGKST